MKVAKLRTAEEKKAAKVAELTQQLEGLRDQASTLADAAGRAPSATQQVAELQGRLDTAASRVSHLEHELEEAEAARSYSDALRMRGELDNEKLRQTLKDHSVPDPTAAASEATATAD